MSFDLKQSPSKKDDLELATVSVEPVVDRLPPLGSNRLHHTRIVRANGSGSDLDEAAELARDKHVYSDEFNATLVKKIDRRIVVFAALVYFAQFLDKNALSYAAVMGIRTDTKLVGQEYSLLGVAFYVAYILSEFPMQWLAQRLPLARFLAFNLVCWAVALGATAACHNFAELMVVRVLLGVFEACVAPILILIISMWYRRENEQGKRISYFYMMNGATQVFCGLISFGVSYINNRHFATWRILFLVLSILTLVLGVAVWVWLPSNPMSANFLTMEERPAAVERVRDNQSGVENKHFKRYQAIEALTELRTWMLLLTCFFASVPNGALALFTQILISSIGYSSKQALALSAPSGALAVIMVIIIGRLSDRWNQRTIIILIALIPTIIGGIILVALGTDSSQKGALLFGIYLTNCISPCFMLNLSYCAGNYSGHTKKGTVNSLVLISFSVANVVGSQTFVESTAPNYYPGKIILVVSLSLAGVCSVCLWALNKSGNKKKRAALDELERDMSPEERQKRQDDSAFLDMTDNENPYFFYTN